MWLGLVSQSGELKVAVTCKVVSQSDKFKNVVTS